MQSKIIKRINALYALANGTSNKGERDNALRRLEALLKKHNLTLNDICTQDKKDSYKINYNNAYEAQLLRYIIARFEADYCYKCDRAYEFECTELQYVEIEFHYSIYRKHLKKSLDDVALAFIVKNKIFPQKWLTEEREQKQLSAQELEDQLNFERVLQSLDYVPVRRALNDNSKR